MTRPAPQEGEIVLYRTPNDAVRVEVLYESETFWLNQKRMAELFGVDLRTISYHLREVYESGELSPEATLRTTWRVQREGNRDVRRELEFYNLDALISVGYRVNSVQATQFRIWETQTLREFIVKGFVLDDERLKLNKRFGKDYVQNKLHWSVTGKTAAGLIAERADAENQAARIPMKMSDRALRLDAALKSLGEIAPYCPVAMWWLERRLARMA